MIETYGADKMAELLEVLGTGRGIDAAMREVYGVGIDEFDNEWRESIGADPVPPPATPMPPPSPTPTPTATATPEPTPTPGSVAEAAEVGPTEPAGGPDGSGSCNALPGGALPLANIGGLAVLGLVGTWRATRSRFR